MREEIDSELERMKAVRRKERKFQTRNPLKRVVNHTQTNSNNNIYTTNNVNNNNYYIFGSKLEEILEHLPLPPPQMNLAPPPLPPVLFGCQSERYEWKLVKQVYNFFNIFNFNLN